MASRIELFEDRAEIVTARGQRFVIDLEDVEKVRGRSWHSNRKGYALAAKGTPLLHRLLLEAPPTMQVDHIDGDPANNRRINLRLCTNAQNSQNQGRRSDNNSGLKGVSWNKQKKRWGTSIGINRKRIHLGYFDTAEQAKAAYDAASALAFGDFKRASEHE